MSELLSTSDSNSKTSDSKTIVRSLTPNLSKFFIYNTSWSDSLVDRTISKYVEKDKVSVFRKLFLKDPFGPKWIFFLTKNVNQKMKIDLL
jgi:hypothetical protein